MIQLHAEQELLNLLYDMLSKADQLEGILKNFPNFWSGVTAMEYASQLLLELCGSLLNSESFIGEEAASTLKKLDEKSNEQ